jgi:glycine cleavage system pyridoxal-binding protein P
VEYKRLIDECLGMDLATALLYERALANKSAMEMDADRIAQRRTGIQQRNRARTQGD